MAPSSKKLGTNNAWKLDESISGPQPGNEPTSLWLILTDVKKVSGFRATATEAEFSSARETCWREIVTRWLIALPDCAQLQLKDVENDHWGTQLEIN